MAKNGVEGVYTADPRTDPDAEFIAEISHRQAIEQRLAVMDSTALSLCMDNELPIHVFNMDDEAQHRPDSVRRAGGNRGEERMNDDVLKDFLDEAGGRMQKSVEATRGEFATVRTGRASPHLLDRIEVDYYGANTPLQPARAGLRHRGAPAHDHALRQELDQGDREGDPRVRRRPHALQRRPGDPAARSPS